MCNSDNTEFSPCGPCQLVVQACDSCGQALEQFLEYLSVCINTLSESVIQLVCGRVLLFVRTNYVLAV